MKYEVGIDVWRKKDGRLYEIWSADNEKYKLRWENSKGNSEMIEVTEKELEQKFRMAMK